MLFRLHTWGWKAAATRLLLAPLAVGAMALPAAAQQYPPGSGARPAAMPPRSTDPAELLRLGRQALAVGQPSAAEQYAAEAARANPSGKWGLWADNPDKLTKDARTAQAKMNRAEAEKLTAQAKELFARVARNDAERIAQLDDAAVRVERACALFGPSTFLEDINPLADRPESLKREIDAARAKVRQRMPVAAAQPASLPKPGGASRPFDLQPAQPVQPATTNRAAAVALMDEGRALLAQNKFVEARAKFAAAHATGATFAYTEENPERGLQDTLAAGKKRIDDLTERAELFAAEKDFGKAEVCLVEARQLSTGLDLYARGIDTRLASVRRRASGSIVAVAAQAPELPEIPGLPKAEPLPLPDLPPVGVKPMPRPVELPDPLLKAKPRPVELPDAPDLPLVPDLPGTPKVPSLDLPPLPAMKEDPSKAEPKLAQPKVEPKPMAAPSPIEEGRKLLDQAAVELKGGHVEMARKLAVKAHVGEYGVKAEAQQLLREIDAEDRVLKKQAAADSFKAAAQAANAKRFDDAKRLLPLIEPSLLSDDQQKQYEKLAALVATETTKPAQPAPMPVAPAPIVPVPGVAAPAPLPTPGALIPSTPAPGGLADQMKAMSEVEYQQLRNEGLQTESAAKQAFDRGDTDAALQLLADFAAKVKASKLSAGRQKLLLDPVERRAENFRIMKRHIDVTVREAREKRANIETKLAKSDAESQKQQEIAKRVRQVQELLAQKNLESYRKAEALALQTKQLAPDDPTLTLIYELAKRNKRSEEYKQEKDSQEDLNLKALNAAEKRGPYVDIDNPVSVSLERARNAQLRGDGSDLYIKARTPIEREIELKLTKPLTVEFHGASMREVIRKFADTAQLNVVVDDAALDAKGIDLDKVTVTERILSPIAMRNVMSIILSKARLMHVVENDVVRVTTEERAKGRLYTKVFSVMDLVTPIPDFALPDHAVLGKALEKSSQPSMPWMNAPQSQAVTPRVPHSGLQPGTGQLVSQPNGLPGGVVPQTGGMLENSPLSSAPQMAPTRQNASARLMQLVTKLVRPYSWEDMGGAGRLDYYDIGGALVVNQTADVIQEVTDLLESLRRLQDLSVAVEVRILTLSEAFFERVGVDFQMNLKTSHSANFERQLTSGQFRPEPFLNSTLGSVGSQVVGWNPAAGGFTSDLNLPIRPNTYGYSVPPYGGYPGNGNGGLNLGLAFLNDIQVFMFLEAAAGDRRSSIMQAPKITAFNGQTVNLAVQDQEYFTTGLQIVNVSGQFIYIPQNTPLPVGGPGGQGVALTIQPIVSSDRMFVRLTNNLTLSSLTSATVPLFPITAFLTPTFEGGSQGIPIPFTQFFQQPGFTSITVQNTVVVPDGGTVILGGLKATAEGRNEFGPPVVSSIPYLNRLFRNTGIGRETRHIMLMITPRIIITREEKERQTGDDR